MSLFLSSHNPLSLLRRDRLDLGRELLMRRHVYRPVFHLDACRIFPEEIVTLSIRRRPNRSRNKHAAAVGTDISQNTFDTDHAEGALIRTDARPKRLRRQRLIAVLASRSKFEHGALSLKLPKPGNQWFLKPFSCP